MKSIAIESLPVNRRKKRKDRTTLYTTTAPLEIISFFYRMGREANEEKKSAHTLLLPDDTPIPDPVCSYKRSRMEPTDSYRGSPCFSLSLGKNSPYKCLSVDNSPMHNLSALDLEVLDSSSEFVDDDVDEFFVDESLDGSPSVLLRKRQLSRNEVPEESFMFSHKTNLKNSKPRSIKKQKWRIGKCRKNSTDYAYSDENDAFRINIAEFQSPGEGELLSGEEKGDGEIPFLNLTKDEQGTGLFSPASPKTHLNSRLKTYERHKGKPLKISWKENSFVTGALIRAATSDRAKRNPKPFIKEEQEHRSVRVLPLSFCTSSESTGQDEVKNEIK